MKNNFKKIISVVIGLIVVVLIIAFIAALFSNNAPFSPDKKITINNHLFKSKTAQTDKEKQIGLSQTKNLPSGYAMLFPFEGEGFYSFWMRDMKFPIDIIYIRSNKIVKIFENVPAPTSKNDKLNIYTSPMPADTVLEIKAGLSKKYKFKEGDIVKIQNI